MKIEMKSIRIKKLSRDTLLFGLILLLGTFLLVYRISELMMFIGDFGWYYLASRDMLETGIIPLVSIPTSHPWLHQGPLWTYLLGIVLWLSDFNPLSGALLAIVFGIGSIMLLYLLASEMYSKKVGLLASLLYATSPLVIIHARMPYHTAPIPFFTILLFYALFKFVRGSIWYFPLVLAALAILYNFELATVLYIPLVILTFIYSMRNRTILLKKKVRVKFFLVSFAALIIPLFPVFIYDTQHGYPQTVKFAAWIGYKLLTIFGYPPLHPEIVSSSIAEVVIFFLQHLQKLLFLPNFFMAFLILISGLIWFAIRIFTSYRKKRTEVSDLLLGLFLLFGIGGFISAKTTSEAYLPMIFPQIILLTALFFVSGLKNRLLQYFVVLFIMLMVFGNISVLLRSNYLMSVPSGGYGPTFTQRMHASEYIVNTAGENRYTLIGAGNGSEFRSFTMNYEYLTWYLGNGPVTGMTSLVYQIRDNPTGVIIERHD